MVKSFYELFHYGIGKIQTKLRCHFPDQVQIVKIGLPIETHIPP